MNPKEKRQIIDLIKRYGKVKGSFCTPLNANCPSTVAEGCPVYQAGQQIYDFIERSIPEGQHPTPEQTVDLMAQTGYTEKEEGSLKTHLDTVNRRFTFSNCQLQLSSKLPRARK